MSGKFACFMNGHEYQVVRDPSNYQHKIRCMRCGKSFSVQDRQAMEEEWDDRLDAAIQHFEDTRTDYFDMLAGRSTEAH